MYRTKKYEIIRIVSASLDDVVRTKLMDSFHKITTDHEGTVNKVDEQGVKEFAYETNHMKKGYYVVVNAAVNNEGIHESERLAHINHSIVRYIIIKTQDEE